MRHFKRRGVIKAFGQWAVTYYGIENLRGPDSYDIPVYRLGEPWWTDHMAAKVWVNIGDFEAALQFAREHFKIKCREGVAAYGG